MKVGRLTRERRRELSRTAFIEAAASLFAEKGYTATSLDQIAEAAGFTRGAMYAHFTGKEDLLIAVIAHYGDLLLGAVDSVSDSPEAAAVAVLQALEGHRELIPLTLELHLLAIRNPSIRPRVAEVEQRRRVASAAM